MLALLAVCRFQADRLGCFLIPIAHLSSENMTFSFEQLRRFRRAKDDLTSLSAELDGLPPPN